MKKDTSDRSEFPYESFNSFDHHPQDWQNIPDVQEFYFQDWEIADNSIRFSPSLSSQHADVKAEIKLTKELKTVEKFTLNAAMPGSENNSASFSIKEDSMDVHVDQGFRRSADTNFNRYYKLKLNRRPLFGFGSLTAGLNYHLASGFYTHHELTLLNENNEHKVQYLNTTVMEMWKFRYFSESLIKYGRNVEKSTTQVLSVRPHNNLLLYALKKSPEGDDKDAFEVGSQIKVTPSVNVFLSGLKDLNQTSGALGVSYTHPEGTYRAKFLLWGLKHANLFFESKLPYNVRASLGLRVPIPDKSVPLPIAADSNPFKFGIKIEKAW